MLLRMHPALQPYAWGSTSAIQEFLSIDFDGPLAEAWYGAHAAAPSKVELNGQTIPLDQAVAENPRGLLGDALESQVGPELPFLMKVLAAGEPLSIQVHPRYAQAISGFAQENAAGLALDNPRRNYRDANEKVEAAFAITEFEHLNGIRPANEIADFFSLVEHHVAADVVAKLKHFGQVGVAGEFAKIGQLDKETLAELVEAVAVAGAEQGDRQGYWINWMAQHYPADKGVVYAAFLRYDNVAPGEMFVNRAGTPHAHLSGTCIEVMENSDNVVRAGITPKNTDIDEFCAVVDWQVRDKPERVVSTDDDGFQMFDPDVGSFAFWSGEIAGDLPYHPKGPEVLLCVGGEVVITEENSAPFNIRKGESIYVGGAVVSARLAGRGTVFRTSVGPNIDRILERRAEVSNGVGR